MLRWDAKSIAQDGAMNDGDVVGLLGIQCQDRLERVPFVALAEVFDHEIGDVHRMIELAEKVGASL